MARHRRRLILTTSVDRRVVRVVHDGRWVEKKRIAYLSNLWHVL
jgi:hypothetical protein